MQNAEAASNRSRDLVCVCKFDPASGCSIRARASSERQAVLTAPWRWALALRQNTFREATGRDTPNCELVGHAARIIRTRIIVGIFTALHQRS